VQTSGNIQRHLRTRVLLNTDVVGRTSAPVLRTFGGRLQGMVTVTGVRSSTCPPRFSQAYSSLFCHSAFLRSPPSMSSMTYDIMTRGSESTCHEPGQPQCAGSNTF
jgi:hypothetical protein